MTRTEKVSLSGVSELIVTKERYWVSGMSVRAVFEGRFLHLVPAIWSAWDAERFSAPDRVITGHDVAIILLFWAVF